MRGFGIGAVFGLFLVSTIVPAFGAELVPPWRICAQAEIIVVGTVNVPTDRDGHISTDERGNADIQIAVAQQLKGPTTNVQYVRYYAKGEPFGIPNSTLLRLGPKRVVLFLVSADDGFGSTRWYFAGDREGFVAASSNVVGQIELEIARQIAVLRAWKPHANALTPTVIRLIGEMTSKEGESAGIRKLQLLGKAAVIPIIDAMDDHRALPLYQVEIQNINPKGWEGILHYGPKEVVDGLDVVLNQLTGENFGNIENGGTDDERARDVAGWRIYEDVLLNHKDWLKEGP